MEQQVLQRIRVRLIIEMLGSPKEHVVKTLRDYVAKLKHEPTIQILKEEYAEAEERDTLFTTFVELEAWFKDASHLLAFCFDAMPSSVEIIEPVELKVQGKDFEGLVNDLQARLHTVDLAIKQLKATNKILDTNGVNTLHNFIIYALKQGPKNVDDIATIVGFSKEKLQPFLEKLAQDNRIRKSDSGYTA